MFFGKSESKSIHISFNSIKVKDATNETKNEEPLVADNSVINTTSYLKLFDCGKTILNNVDSTYEQAFMGTLQVK